MMAEVSSVDENYSWSDRVNPTIPNGESLASERTVDGSDDEMPDLYNPFEDETGDDASDEPLWLCRQCNSPSWRLMTGWYRCGRCGSENFYDARADPPPPPDHSWKFEYDNHNRENNRHRKPDDPEPSDAGSHRERGESETATHDTTVDPETLQPLSRRQKRLARRENRVGGERAQSQPGNTTALPSRMLQNMTSQTSPNMTSNTSGSDRSKWRDDMLKGLTNAVTKEKDKDKDWSLKKGPAPGIKYRGGSPPNPPHWSYQKDDLRAFQKWERKIEVWKIQVSAYLPPNEAAMHLYVSLKGEAEEELEWCDIAKINSDNGIQYIVDTLRQPLMTRSVYLKRKYLHEYEYVQRQNNESIRAFCNRYGRIERSLKSVNINVEGMYDVESRGARLLERMRLGLEQQRLILVASGQSLVFDTIREAAQIQFPDHRPTPPVVFTREFDGGRQDSSASQHQRNGQPPRHPKGNPKGTKGAGKGKPSSSGPPRTTYVTEHPEMTEAEVQEDAEDPPDEDQENEFDEDGEVPPQDEDGDCGSDAGDDDLASNLAEVAKCLTVTARRLQGMTLGRKFSGGSKSIDQRKAETHCAVCGQKGHWQGDSECPQSSSASKDPKGKPPNAGNKKPDSKPSLKKVMTVSYGRGSRKVNIEDIPETNENSPKKETYGTCFTTFMVKVPNNMMHHQVLANSVHSFKNYMVLDTACQRTCCSTKWFDEWSKNASKKHLQAKTTSNREPFEFGHGPPQYSHLHAYIPVCFDYHLQSICLVGTCVINTTNDIPLLGSHDLLKKMKAVIDLPNQEVRFQEIQCCAPICLINGHLAVDITCFPEDVSRNQEMWQSFMDLTEAGDADVEFITAFSPSSESKPIRSGDLRDAHTSLMASGMASDDGSILPCRDVPGSSGGPSYAATHSTSKLGELSGSTAYGGKGVSDPSCPLSVPARTGQTIWKPPRAVQQLPVMRKEVEMERRQRPVARRCTTAGQAAAALTILLQCPGLYRQQAHSGFVHGPGSIPFCEDSNGTSGLGDGFPILTVQTGSGSTSEEFTKTSKDTEEKHIKKGAGRGDGRRLRVGLRDPMNAHYEIDETYANDIPEHADVHDVLSNDKVLEEIYVPEDAEVSADEEMVKHDNYMTSSVRQKKRKRGNQTWMLGHLKAQRKIYDKEVQIYKSLISHAEDVKAGSKADMMTIDLMEVFAGKARLTDMAAKFGLSATQPFDLLYDIDLKTPEGIKLVKKAVKKLKPLLLMVAWPCTVWSLFNRNLNYTHRLEELESLREEDRPLVELGVDLCYEQITDGRYFLGENPVRLDLWKEPSVVQLREHADTNEAVCDAGAYGAESHDGWPIVKPHRWITNSSIIAENLSRRMTDEQKAYTKPVEGRDTKASGEYCDGLVNAILSGLQMEAKCRNPQRFMKQQIPSKVYYVHPSADEEAWKRILDDVEKKFQNTYKRPIVLSEQDPMHHAIQELVPWELTRIQLAWTPAARRWPLDVTFTHRGCAMRTADNQFRLEHDDESSAKYPNQRFSESIRVGVFFYGMAAEEDPNETGGKRVIGVSTDIWFEGGPPMSREMQSSVARLHCNLGHPPKQEIVRILAAAGKLDSKLLAALDALRCGSCIRMTKTTKPPTSSTSSAVRFSGALETTSRQTSSSFALWMVKHAPFLE